MYDGLILQMNGRELPAVPEKGGVSVSAPLAPNESVSLRITYRSQGLESWKYG
jgi:hypothetical protein